MSKAPAYQWYPGDFRRDTALQACSFYARSVWREMLDLMHDGEPYGHLTAGGVPLGTGDLARMLGESRARIDRSLQELEVRNVFSRTEHGVIYSRRMVRDHINRQRRAAGGLKSLNNPNVPRPKDPESVNGRISSQISLDGSLPPSLGGSPAVASASAVTQKLPDPSPSPGEKEKPPVGGPKKAASQKDRGRQLPPDWQPTADHRKQAASNVSVDTEADRFRDWTRAKGQVYRDWDAAFRNWLRKAAEFKTAQNGNRPPAGSPAASLTSDDEERRYRENTSAARSRTNASGLEQQAQRSRVNAWRQANRDAANALQARVGRELLDSGVVTDTMTEFEARAIVQTETARRILTEKLGEQPIANGAMPKLAIDLNSMVRK